MLHTPVSRQPANTEKACPDAPVPAWSVIKIFPGIHTCHCSRGASSELGSELTALSDFAAHPEERPQNPASRPLRFPKAVRWFLFVSMVGVNVYNDLMFDNMTECERDDVMRLLYGSRETWEGLR